MTNHHIKVKPLTTGQLAELYEVNERTFKHWLEPFIEELGERRGNFYTITQVETIFANLGVPPSLKPTK